MTNQEKFYVEMPVTPETIRDYEIKRQEIVWHKIGNKLHRCILVPVDSDEIRRAIMRGAWSEAKREERKAKRAAEGKSREVSIDAMIESYGDVLASADNITEEYEAKILIEELWKVVDALEEIDKKIVKMISQGYTETQIAKEVKCSQKTVNNHKHKVFAVIREKLKFFL